MGFSRRTFTREMKIAALRRLENGSSTAEVARALEVNQNTLLPMAEGVSGRSRECLPRNGHKAVG